MYDLIQDTLTFLKDPLLPKQSFFVSAELSLFFKEKQILNDPKIKTPPVSLNPISSLKSTNQTAKMQDSQESQGEKHLDDRQADKERETTPPLMIEETAATEPVSDVKKTLLRIAPQIKLTDPIPDDTEAKRIATGWKEWLFDIEVVLIACATDPETMELLKGLAKAIDQQLGKSKIISPERLEREKRWDLFFKHNSFRLTLATAGIEKFPELKRAHPSSFLSLEVASVYRLIEKKADLWKTLCQMLKKPSPL